jgi:uncharacterized protein YoxC
VFEGDRVSGGEIAGLIAALAFLLLVGVLIVPILKLRHTVDAATRALTELTDKTGPLLSEANRTVDSVHTAVEQLHTSLDGVNTQLERLDVITGHAQQISGNVAHLSTIVSGAASSPLVKVTAFGYGVRKAVNARRHSERERDVRSRLAEERRIDKRTRNLARAADRQARGFFRRAAQPPAEAGAAAGGNGKGNV